MATQHPDQLHPPLPLGLLAAALAPLRAVSDPGLLAEHVADLLCQSVVLACRIDLNDETGGRTVAERPGSPTPDVAARWVTMPLTTRGRTLGELIVGLATTPDGETIAALEAIGRSLGAAVAAAADHRQAFQVSDRLQRSLLPSALPDGTWFELAASYVPATAGLSVGGDWYDAQLLSSGELALSVGDVAGHGVEAAARMGELRSAIAALRLASRNPDDLIGHLHRVCAPAGYFATAICARLSPTGRFRWSSAGHLPPVLARARGTVELVMGRQSPPLGTGVEGPVPLNQWRIGAGDTVLLYTDGLVERRDEGLTTTIDRLVGDVAAAPSLDPSQLVDHVVAARHDAGPTQDDIAVLAARLVARTGG